MNDDFRMEQSYGEQAYGESLADTLQKPLDGCL